MDLRGCLRSTHAGVVGVGLLITVACDHGKLDVPAAGQDEIQKVADTGAETGSSAPVAAAPATGGAGGAITGTITVSPALAAKATPGATIFVMARPAGMDKGPPLASIKLTADRFPIEFRIGPEDVMMGGEGWQGQVSLSARLDTDGNAMTREATDISGALGGAVAVGSSGVTLELNTEGGTPSISSGMGAAAGTVPAGMGSSAPAGMAAQMPTSSAGTTTAAGGDAITGTITLASSVASSAPSGATVFVIARPAGMDKGPPLASIKLSADRFPLQFRIGPENVMMQGMPWQGQVSLSARLDTDGNAMTKGAGDIAGAVAAPVTVGTQGVSLELNQPL